MTANQIEVGSYYVAKISNKITVVKILEVSPYKGWNAENAVTGRAVRIKTAGKLRRKVTQEQLDEFLKMKNK